MTIPFIWGHTANGFCGGNWRGCSLLPVRSPLLPSSSESLSEISPFVRMLLALLPYFSQFHYKQRRFNDSDMDCARRWLVVTCVTGTISSLCWFNSLFRPESAYSCIFETSINYHSVVLLRSCSALHLCIVHVSHQLYKDYHWSSFIRVSARRHSPTYFL